MSTRSERRPSPTSEAGEEREVRHLPLEVRPPTPDALCIETPLSSLEAPVTPTAQHFVRNHFATPRIELEHWRLTVEGEVEQPLILSYDDLRALPHQPLTAVLECAGNSRASINPRPEGVLWKNGAVGAARWSGIPLRLLLERAKVRPGAVEVMFRGLDHGKEPGIGTDLDFEMSIALDKAMDPATIIADEMNGKPLTPRHGFPARAVVPGWYAMASVKWLSRIVVLRQPFEGYFRARAYAYIAEGEAAAARHPPVTAIRVKSLITWPNEGQVLSPGTHRIRGVAWSGAARIERVEVSVGGFSESREEETWHPAELTERGSPYDWTHWECTRDLHRPGFYVIRVRATDEKGHVQPYQAKWNFRGLGNNSVHQVPVEVKLA